MDYILENYDDFKQANQEYSLKLDKWKKKLKELKWKLKKYDELETTSFINYINIQ